MAVTLDLDPSSKHSNARQIEYVRAVIKIASDYQKLHKTKELFESLDPSDSRFKEVKSELNKIKKACAAHPIELFYGGGIRGGKTYAGMACLIILCKAFPGSRWGVIRKSMPVMQLAISSLKKIIGNSQNVYWKLQAKESYCQFENGSRIYFIAENYQQDKQLTKFLGLELNGVLFEQLEEVTEKGFNIIKSRIGSWYNVRGAMPPALILANFNPTFNWVKKSIYDRWKKKQLDKHQRFYLALAKDNPHVTEQQWRAWDTLDEDTKARMIHGEWDIEVKKAFLYSFSEGKNTRRNIGLDFKHEIWISFDFNVDPMTAVVFQTDKHSFFRVPLCFKEPNSDTYSLCRKIAPLIKGREHLVRITGDASGKNRISGSDGALNQYQIIARELGLKDSQFVLPNFNPPIADRRVFCNSIIQNFPECVIDESLEDLIHDIKFTTCALDRNGEISINKTGVNEYTGVDNKQMGHLMDCFTYGLMVTLYDFVKIHKS